MRNLREIYSEILRSATPAEYQPECRFQVVQILNGRSYIIEDTDDRETALATLQSWVFDPAHKATWRQPHYILDSEGSSSFIMAWDPWYYDFDLYDPRNRIVRYCRDTANLSHGRVVG